MTQETMVRPDTGATFTFDPDNLVNVMGDLPPERWLANGHKAEPALTIRFNEVDQKKRNGGCGFKSCILGDRVVPNALLAAYRFTGAGSHLHHSKWRLRAGGQLATLSELGWLAAAVELPGFYRSGFIQSLLQQEGWTLEKLFELADRTAQTLNAGGTPIGYEVQVVPVLETVLAQLSRAEIPVMTPEEFAAALVPEQQMQLPAQMQQADQRFGWTATLHYRRLADALEPHAQAYPDERLLIDPNDGEARQVYPIVGDLNGQEVECFLSIRLKKQQDGSFVADGVGGNGIQGYSPADPNGPLAGRTGAALLELLPPLPFDVFAAAMMLPREVPVPGNREPGMYHPR